MRKRRVVITGMGAISPCGIGLPAMMDALQQERCCLSTVPDDLRIPGMECCLAGLVPPIPDVKRIPRELRRSMSPMSIYALLAAKEALAQAGLPEDDLPRMGVCLGSTMGSGQELHSLFASFIPTNSLDAVRTMAFFKIMPHTASTALAIALGLFGRLLNPTAACAAGLQGIGMAYEAIAFGREDRMLCGGTEEYSPLTTATFDKIGAASHAREAENGSRPFDIRRDGIVCSEGAGVLVLEEKELAEARGARIIAEIAGFATASSPRDIAHPSTETTIECMRAALDDAGLAPRDIAYVNAHATATVAGDVAESQAIAALWGDTVPVSSLKGILGHAMAASGALEVIACADMMRHGHRIGCRSDLRPDPACVGVRLAPSTNKWSAGPIIKNSFALGGVYASLVLRPARG